MVVHIVTGTGRKKTQLTQLNCVEPNSSRFLQQVSFMQASDTIECMHLRMESIQD